MAHLKDITITEDKIYQGGFRYTGVRFCSTDPLRQALIYHCRDCFQIPSLSSSSSTSVPDENFNSTAQQKLGCDDSLL